MAKIKRPRDPMQLAKLMMDMATGEVPNDKEHFIKKVKKKKASQIKKP